MKTIFSLLVTSLIGLSVLAQTGKVTITVKGNRTTQVAVDDQYYNVNNSSTTAERTITLSSLNAGSHSLEIVRRSNNYSAATNSINTSFYLRQGYDLAITVAANGSINQSETRISTGSAVSSTVFNRIYTQTRNRTSSTSRAAYLENEFSNSNRMFTSGQASQLIRLVNSENLRFDLAKQVYIRITDRENFSQVSALLNSTAHQDELNEYIATVGDEETDDESAGTPMSNARFQVIYNELLGESGNTNKQYYLNNFFSKEFNFYTSSQARQLIQQVTTEAGRLYLAKLAYRGTTDRENYEQVVQLLSSPASRTELNTYTSTYNQGNSRTPMSFTAFNSLYQAAYYQSSSSSRYASIKNAFTTTGNYFTVAQAKQLIQLMNDESSRLQLAKLSYGTLVDQYNYTQLNELFTTSAGRNEFNKYVNSYGTGTAVVMSDAEFTGLYNNVNNSWSSATRYNLVSDAFNNSRNYLSAYQVKQLLLLVSSESERLTLAKAAYDNVVDPANFNQVYDVFSSSAYRNELSRYVSSVGGVATTRTPMTASEFSSMKRDVQYTFGLGAKMSSLTKIFNNETYYFTAQQAKELIELVSAESNRLELAKLSYNNLTDPVNYQLISQVLASQSSRDEYSAYISANPNLNN